VIGAVQAGGSLEEVMHQLLTHPQADTTAAADDSSNAHDSSGNNNASTDLNANDNACAPDSTPTNLAVENLSPDTLGIDNSNEGPSAEQRDLEMEDEIADELTRGDALSDYNIDVTQEGDAINEYLALLDSGGGNGKASSSQLSH
jgi:hypothetical protein